MKQNNSKQLELFVNQPYITINILTSNDEFTVKQPGVLAGR